MSVVSIGLEIHIALKVDGKSFAPERWDESSWVSLGFPGTLPVLNMKAVEKTIMISHLLGCGVNHENIVFDRKNYFYHDLPRGYQITQYFHPIGLGGEFRLRYGRRIGIRRVHMEEDTAQQFREGDEIKFNFSRLGRALAEIVTEPDFRSYEEVEEFLSHLRRICLFNGISDVAYENGEIRVDLNVSVRSQENDHMGPKSEVKNLNSLRAIKKSIWYLVNFHEKSLDAGENIESMTYTWSEENQSCVPMRRKNTTSDYFYVPEANLPPVRIGEARYRDLVKGLVSDFGNIKESFLAKGLKESEAVFILDHFNIYEMVMKLESRLGSLTGAYNWVVNIVLGMLEDGDWSVVSYGDIEKVVLMVEKERKLNMKIAKEVIKKMVREKIGFDEAYGAFEVNIISDGSQLRHLMDEVLAHFSDQREKLMSNPVKMEKLIMGECMKRTRGQADPNILKGIMDEAIKGWV